MRELLIEITPQPIELLGLAQVLGRDRLVVLDDERPVIRAARLVLPVPPRERRFGRRVGIAQLRIVGHLGGERLGRLGGGVGHVLARDVGFVDARLRVLGVRALAVLTGFLLAAILLTLLTFYFVRL